MQINIKSFILIISYLITLLQSSAQIKTESIVQSIENQNDSTKMVQLKTLSWNLRNINPVSSLKYATQAVNIAKNINDTLQLASLYNYMGVFENKMSQLALALEYYYKALNYAQSINNNVETGYAYNNIGEIYAKQQNNEEALVSFERAIDYFTMANHLKGLAYSYSMLGQLFTKKGGYQKALEYFFKSVEIAHKLNDFYGLASREYLIAKLYFKQENYTLAEGYCLKSIENHRKHNQKLGLSEGYLLLGQIETNKENLNKAINNFTKSIQISNEINAIDVEATATYQLSRVYKKLYEYEKAYKYLELFKLLNDSINSAEDTKFVTQLNMQYEFNKVQKEEEIKQQKKELLYQLRIKRQKIISLFIISGLLLVFVFLLIVARYAKKVKKINQSLKLKNAEIIEQKEEIRAQRDEIENHLEETQQQRDFIFKQNRQIKDSIGYAERIQNAILPSDGLIGSFFSDFFIYHKSKDIVSGDFYWAADKAGFFYFVVADCTGHGVPGAIMSMLGMAFLNDVVNSSATKSASRILELLRTNVKQALKQTGDMDESKDGMDMALCIINKKTLEMSYAGANRPLYIYRNNKQKQLLQTENPVGIYFKEIPFKEEKVQLKKDDKIYLFTDGITDQFGGPENKKFMSSRLINLFEKNLNLSFARQKHLLTEQIQNWIMHKKPDGGNYKQLDDMLVAGLKI